MVCCSKYNFSDFIAAILNFMFYKKTHKDKSSTYALISPYGEPAKHNQNRKQISQNNVSRSFTALSGCFCLYLHEYRFYNIFFLKRMKEMAFSSHIWTHKNRHIIYVSSVCSCKIIRKYVYFYIHWRPSWISPFWTFYRPLTLRLPGRGAYQDPDILV